MPGNEVPNSLDHLACYKQHTFTKVQKLQVFKKTELKRGDQGVGVANAVKLKFCKYKTDPNRQITTKIDHATYATFLDISLVRIPPSKKHTMSAPPWPQSLSAISRPGCLNSFTSGFVRQLVVFEGTQGIPFLKRIVSSQQYQYISAAPNICSRLSNHSSTYKSVPPPPP